MKVNVFDEIKSFSSKSGVFFLLGALLLSFSCAKKNNDTRGTPGVGSFSNTCGNGTSAVGRIHHNNDPTVSLDFRTRVQAFVSSWMDTNQLGEVDGAPEAAGSRVELRGKLRFDSAGNLIKDQSGVQIQVIDSFQLNNGTPPISVADYSNKGISGSFNGSTGALDVSFEDGYGKVKLVGVADSSTIRGQFQFVNSKAFGGLSPQQGAMYFSISRCGLLE